MIKKMPSSTCSSNKRSRNESGDDSSDNEERTTSSARGVEQKAISPERAALLKQRNSIKTKKWRDKQRRLHEQQKEDLKIAQGSVVRLKDENEKLRQQLAEAQATIQILQHQRPLKTTGDAHEIPYLKDPRKLHNHDNAESKLPAKPLPESISSAQKNVGIQRETKEKEGLGKHIGGAMQGIGAATKSSSGPDNTPSLNMNASLTSEQRKLSPDASHSFGVGFAQPSNNSQLKALLQQQQLLRQQLLQQQQPKPISGVNSNGPASALAGVQYDLGIGAPLLGRNFQFPPVQLLSQLLKGDADDTTKDSHAMELVAQMQQELRAGTVPGSAPALAVQRTASAGQYPVRGAIEAAFGVSSSPMPASDANIHSYIRQLLVQAMMEARHTKPASDKKREDRS